MRFIASVLGLTVILFLCVGANAYSAGLERYPQAQINNTKQNNKLTKNNDSSELTSFLKKGPAILDGVALSVKDILHQLGLTKNSR
jgi:hypothetical protein